MQLSHSIAHFQSPIGLIEIQSLNEEICSVLFVENNIEFKESVSQVISECIKQMTHYFNGTLTIFNLPISQKGTVFQNKVWGELINIPYGETISYLQLSQNCGSEKSVRAVGAANGKNKILIVLPCHRVIGSDGSLTGYAGGLERKKWLLKHEINNTIKPEGKLF